METFLIKKATEIPVINPLIRPTHNPIIIACDGFHQCTILFKNQNAPVPITAKAKVEKIITKVLNPAVINFLFIPTKTDADKAPIPIKLKITSSTNNAMRIAAKTLIQIKMIPKIRSTNKNKLNSSSMGGDVCRKKSTDGIKQNILKITTEVKYMKLALIWL